MGKYPILKPREVVSILEKLDFIELRQRGHINNIDILMEDVLQYHFIKDEIYLQFYFVK